MAIPMMRHTTVPPPSQARRIVLTALGALLIAIVVALSAAALSGVLSLAVIGATAFGLALLRWPHIATLAFAFALYANVPVVAKDYYGIPEIVAAGFVGLLLIPFVGRLIRRDPFIVAPTLPLLLLYSGVLSLSTAVALVRGTPAGSGPIELFLTEGMIIFVLITQAVTTPRMLRLSVWALLLAGLFMGALSVHQAVTESYDTHYGGFAQVYGRALTDDDPDNEAQPRASGPVGEKNRYAQVLLVLLPLALAAFWVERRSWLRAAAALAALVILSAVLLTFSRGAGIGLLVLLVLLVALRQVKPAQLAGMVLIGVVAISVLAPAYGERLVSITTVQGLVSEDAEDPDGSILGRTTSNLAALYVFADHPVIGVGPGMYAPHFSLEYANELGLRRFTTDRRAHNLYVETAAELGIIGLFVFLGIVGMTLRGLWRARRRWLDARPELAHWATGFGLALVAYLTTAAFLHLSYQRYFWLLLALANAAVWILNRESESEPREGARALSNRFPRLYASQD